MILPVMINFMCRFAWVRRFPDIWLNIILSVSVRVDLDEINLRISRPRKAD